MEPVTIIKPWRFEQTIYRFGVTKSILWEYLTTGLVGMRTYFDLPRSRLLATVELLTSSWASVSTCVAETCSVSDSSDSELLQAERACTKASSSTRGTLGEGGAAANGEWRRSMPALEEHHDPSYVRWEKNNRLSAHTSDGCGDVWLKK